MSLGTGRLRLSRRIAAILVAVSVVGSACAEATDTAELASTTSMEVVSTTASSVPHSEDTASSTTVAPARTDGLPDGPSALETRESDEFPEPLIEPAHVLSGGPPPDGIPPIDDPEFVDVAGNSELLPEAEPVVALEIDGDARAYPVRAMVWHEIVNDVVGSVPVSVTYCPLCNSAATYGRRIRGVTTTFGTSGMLYASALVMYDRATESLWTHYNGTSVIGVLAGEELDSYPSPLMSWGQFVDAYPSGQVLDWTKTGVDRDYGRNPYTAYDDPEKTPFLFRGALDDREAAMQRVVGIAREDTPAAFTLDQVSGGAGLATHVEVGDEGLVVFWAPGQASALDTSEIAEGRDVGTVGVFIPEVAGEPLTFTAVDGRFVDDETGSTWTVAGQAVEGDHAGTTLVQVPHLDTFWFAWSTYQPGTTLNDL